MPDTLHDIGYRDTVCRFRLVRIQCPWPTNLAGRTRREIEQMMSEVLPQPGEFVEVRGHR
jgi:hypothetical protein